MAANIVITGFMGTGKSTVGRAVAKKLGMAFVDMDDVIVERAGMPIAAIFAARGEGAFRDLESEVATELARRKGLVIATGGGTMMRAENRAALGCDGWIVCLTCEPREIVRRLKRNASRPLLAEGDKQERIEALLASRAAVYASLPVVLETTGQTVAEVAEAIVVKYREEVGGSATQS